MFATRILLFAKTKTPTLRRLSPALTKSHKLSPSLAAIVGKPEATRQEALKGVWDYIKAHNLQNPAAKREIVADDKLSNMFGQGKATIFEVRTTPRM